VVTVTAGRPGPHPLTDWDRTCGFGEGDDVVAARRAEDEAAVALLGARPRWLDFLDRQYAGGTPPDPAHVAGALRRTVEHAALVASPLGLLHPDHVAVAEACAMLRPGRWIVYEDVIYRAQGAATEERMAAFRNDGLVLEPIDVAKTPRKRDAIARYTSQVRGLADLLEDAYRPERYWTVTTR
jgi:LmbE family N-acetylglucosaminyl deacetylase